MPTKKSTTKTSVIRATNGSRLRLTPTRLVQIDHTSMHPWYVTKEALKRAVRLGIPYVSIHQVCAKDIAPYCLTIHFSAQSPQPKIGCCAFSVATFRQILRHFGIRKSRKAGA